MLVSGDRFCPECGTPQDATGPGSVSATEYSSAWDAVVRVLRSNLGTEYRITRELGRGGQAAVFQADELALNRTVAIKVLAPGSVNGDREVEMFRREAQTIANLKHPHIVTIYSVRQVEDLHLFVMQYIEGRALSSIIAERGQLPLTAARAVAFQVGSALQYAHRRNVIHRDVKPANVLFDEDGNAIVTDFGIAKDISRPTSSVTTGGLMGTLAYMSPEQCYQLPVTWESDQYSLGILLYEMLTGRVPYSGSVYAIMQGHTDREPPPIRSMRGDCPVELEWAVLRMLAKKPADRWPSIPDALAAIGATPLTRDDPIRIELKRLAHWPASAVPVGAGVGPMRLSLRLPDRLEVGEQVRSEVVGAVAAGAAVQPLRAAWSISDPGLARFDESSSSWLGLAPGRAVVSATTEHGSIEGALIVVPAVVRDVLISLPRKTLEVGETVRAIAEVRDKRGSHVVGPVAWSSSNPQVATVTREGEVRALSHGSAQIAATASGTSAERTLFVEEAAAVSIALSPAPSLIEPLQSFRLAGEVFDDRGVALAARELSWESSDPSVATVDQFGVVSTQRPGQVTITARSGGAIAMCGVIVRETAASMSSPYSPPAWSNNNGDEAVIEDYLAPSDPSPYTEPIRSRGPGEFDQFLESYRSGTQTVQRSNDSWIATGNRMRWMYASVGGVALLLSALYFWPAENSPEPPDPSVVMAVRTQIGSRAQDFLTNERLAYGDVAFEEAFRTSGSFQGGWINPGQLVLDGSRQFYSAPTWLLPEGDFVLQVELAVMGDSIGHFAGLAFGTVERGRYLVMLEAARPSPRLFVQRSSDTGQGYTDVMRPRRLTGLSQANAVLELVAARNTLTILVRGATGDPLVVNLNGTPSGRFAVFTRAGKRSSFQRVAAATLRPQ